MDLELTKAEEKAMKILWSIKKGVIRDVVKEYEEPKPAYTTVATIFKILERKGFVGRKPIANTHEYYPLIKREEYTNGFMKSFIKKYFSNSFKNLVSEFSSKEELSTKEMEELIEHFKNKIEDKNKK
ncbi:BlaI/MecI/CopY family transcriptional regulator [Flavobacteriaceae bacterium AU392]|nr:BlaI/MecI/CopY family transcriptional regulator [Flavobacteriaceae bacterium]RKM82704.1 BlaI/MecI/CopY family transcriptional regulator [Flavobacteriaceae bacterium AU392]